MRQEALGPGGRTRCWCSAAATPWPTSSSGSRRGSRPGTYPAPKLRWSSIRRAASTCRTRWGSWSVRPTGSSTPTASSTTSTRCPRSTRLQPGDAGDPLKETTTTFDKPEPIFQIKCDVHPWMSAYVGVFTHPVLLGRRARTGSSRSRASTRDLRDHRLARAAGDADGIVTVDRGERPPGLQVRPPRQLTEYPARPAKSADRETMAPPRVVTAPQRTHAHASTTITRSSASGASTSSRPITR